MGRKTKRGATSKPIKPTMKERSVFELRGGTGNMNPFAKMSEKGLIGDNESLHARAKRLYGGRTTKEKLNPFDQQSKTKRQYKRSEISKGNFNWKDKLRTTAKVAAYLATGGKIGKRMQEIAENQ